MSGTYTRDMMLTVSIVTELMTDQHHTPASHFADAYTVIEDIQETWGSMEVRHEIVEFCRRIDTAWQRLPDNIREAVFDEIGCWDMEWVPWVIASLGSNWLNATIESIINMTTDAVIHRLGEATLATNPPTTPPTTPSTTPDTFEE